MTSLPFLFYFTKSVFLGTQIGGGSDLSLIEKWFKGDLYHILVFQIKSSVVYVFIIVCVCVCMEGVDVQVRIWEIKGRRNLHFFFSLLKSGILVWEMTQKGFKLIYQMFPGYSEIKHVIPFTFRIFGFFFSLLFASLFQL